MQNYMIGEIAERLGVTKEAIRYYERLDIVRPERDYLNNYRYYDGDALTELQKIRAYRHMGFSLRQANALVKESDPDKLLSRMRKMRGKLRKSIESLNASVERIDNEVRVFLEIYDSDPQLVTSPHLLWLPLKGDSPLQDEAAWANQMPTVRLSPRFSIGEATVKFERGFCVTKEEADALGLPISASVRSFPSCAAIRYVINHGLFLDDSLDRDLFRPVMEFAEKRGLVVRDDFLGRGIVALGCDKRRTFYVEVWLPIIPKLG